MSNIRFKALELSMLRSRRQLPSIPSRPSAYFGELTFNKAAMSDYLSREAYKAVQSAIEQGIKIDRKIADQIASGMKSWAISKGATHFSHWFHPLTGATAEKHDAFITLLEDGKAIENFTGNELVQQEPDASSFPHGGIRNTFEARGYSAWDPTSPAFILEGTLCIPTIFISYTGESLDYKLPLIKALSALELEATEVCHYFDKNINRVQATLGWEQEYFLVDTALYSARPDLSLTGRTLFGHASAKDQQLSDHYFGVIPERVMDFMREFEYEALRLGIPVRTRHNEVAPAQFECAPAFEEVNVAIDHNQLLMLLLDKISKRHGLTVLLHEKPYANINGSGKHNNWSMMTNTGENLLKPGKTPEDNLKFLVFLVNIIKAVDSHADILRAYIASAGNDLRLGGHEAPPAIISVFIGSRLTEALQQLESETKHSGKSKAHKPYDIPIIPEILPDNTDRNRTSPFAFTGNKFEFRAVGSSANCAVPMIALNTIVANQLKLFRAETDRLVAQNISREDAMFQILSRYIKESKKVLFEGNSYSQEWVEEAARRGLSNVPDTPRALKNLISKQAISVFEENNVLTEREIYARYDIQLENYVRKVQIESRVIGDLAVNHIIPIAIRYQNQLIENVKGLKEVLDTKTFQSLSKTQTDTIREISDNIISIKNMVSKMVETRKEINKQELMEQKAVAYRDRVFPFFDEIKYHVDKLELLIDDEMWPLPKYRELLFINR
ncbi:MAG: glutamine synthetase III [Chloroflexota bacterium]